MFSDLLNPGGRLLLCCPHAAHPEHSLGRTDEPETGYHVRDGLHSRAIRRCLRLPDLELLEVIGIGSPLLCRLDKFLRGLRTRVGDLGALPIFILLLPLTWSRLA